MASFPVRKEISGSDGDAVMEYRWSGPGSPVGTNNLLMDDMSFDELADLAGVPRGDHPAAAIRDPSVPLIHANGWQSWSPGWELDPGERIPRARLIPKLNLFTERPGRLDRGNDVVAHFVTYLRNGEHYLAIASVNEGTPPISYAFDRKRGRVRIHAYAPGKRFAPGERVARIRVFYREGFFALRDALRGAFAGLADFGSLSFLGDGTKGKPRPGGYESWYNHYADIDSALIRADLDAIDANPNLINEYYVKRGKPAVFQIDDGWEKAIGDWRIDETRFPEGLTGLSAAIERKGLVPGLWFAPFILQKKSRIISEKPEWILRDAGGRPVVAGWNPSWEYDFHCLDISLPAVRDYILEFLRKAVNEWGYRYLKLDFLYAGLLPGVHSGGGSPYEHYETMFRGIRAIRRDDGKPVALLGCGAPLESSFRHMPLMRIGADTLEAWDRGDLRFLRHMGRPSALLSLRNTIGRAMFDGSVFLNDPDVVFCRSVNMRLSDSEKELLALANFMFASQLMFSDDPGHFGAPGEREFTARVVRLYDDLAGIEMAAYRIEGLPDAFRLVDREGRFEGVANLSDAALDIEGPWNPERSLSVRCAFGDGRATFAPRSLSVFRT